jgi:tRNA 2-selenouridine synthase
MCTAPRIRIAAPLTARADYLARAYADVTTDAARLVEVITRLRSHHPADTIAAWLSRAETGDFEMLAAELMAAHYDPRYEKHRARFAPERETVVDAASLAPDAIDTLAARIAAAARDLFATR